MADSLDGESSLFVRTLEKHNLSYVLSIRSDRRVRMPSYQRVRANKWYKFSRTFSNQKSEERYIREIIFGRRHSRTYWEITTDTQTMPDNSTSFAIANIQEKRNQMKKTIGNLYGLRTWGEYGLRQCKQELGWTNYRLTKFPQIENWWELIMSAYLMISLNTQPFLSLNSTQVQNCQISQADVDGTVHQQWNQSRGWKNVLNNFRLVIQPTILLWSIFPVLQDLLC